MLVVLTLNFFLFEPEFVLVFRLTRLSSSRRWAGMTADLACQMSSCLCRDYNILLLFKHKRDILYTGNVEYILLCRCLEQKTGIQNYTTTTNISLFLRGNLQVSMEIWRMRNKFPSCLELYDFLWKQPARNLN